MNSVRARIAVLEDEPDLREAVAEYLGANGYSVAVAADASEMRALVASQDFDLAILDIAMPGEDGLSLGRWLRSRAPIGLIFATAAGTPIDKIVGLELGADDYVTKPFSLEELTARSRAVLRRSTGDQAPPRLSFADLELDEESHEVYRAGDRVALSPTEFKLLRYLMLNANRVLSKAQILDHVWNYDFRGDDNIVESYISYLRRKVDSVEPKLIHTLRGVGYVLRMPG
jgi:two-component system, OmpR family, response regulator